MKFPRLKYVALSAIGLLVFAVGLLLLVAVLPAAGIENEFVKGIFPIIAFVSIVLSGLTIFVCMVLSIFEIATSTNNTTWKGIWVIVILVGGIIGIAIYELIAKKDLKATE